MFSFCVVTFEAIKVQTYSAPQNDRLDLSFVKDIHIVGGKWPETVVKRPLNTLLSRFPKKGGGYYKTEILATLILESLW
jgi:hypothetical protein